MWIWGQQVQLQRGSTISGKSHESLPGDEGRRGIRAEGTDRANPQREAEEWPTGVHAPDPWNPGMLSSHGKRDFTNEF